MLNPIDYDYWTIETRERIVRQFEQSRALPKNEDAAEKPGMLLKMRLAVASALALFYGG